MSEVNSKTTALEYLNDIKPPRIAQTMLKVTIAHSAPI
jgi:hypothetical protein